MVDSQFRIGVLGSGKGTNCEAILEACKSGEITGEVVVVLSDQPEAKILERANRWGVSSHCIGPGKFKTKLEPDLEHQMVDVLREADVDLIALAGYMKVLKEPMLQSFKGRIVNIHPSLLPSFPGLRAWEQALAYGAKVAGCTAHFVNEQIDTGPIILQEAVPVFDDDTADTLHQRIQDAEHRIYPKAIQIVGTGNLQIQDRRVIISS